MQFPKYSFDENQLIEIAKSFFVKELYIFGSILRDDFNSSSDIDLLIELPEDHQYSYFDILELKEKFEHLLQRNVDIVEKRSLRNPYRRNNILNTARKIYAA